MSTVKQIGTDVHEAVIKSVADEFGRAVEQGIQQVTGAQPTLDPQTQQKKQEEDVKKKNWALKVIDWYKKIQASQEQVRQQQKQTDSVKIQQEEEEKKKKKIDQYQVMEKEKTAQDLGLVQAQRKTEIRGGVGG